MSEYVTPNYPVRKCCYSCNNISNQTRDTFKCPVCDCDEGVASEHFDDAYGNHQKNQQTLAEALELVAVLTEKTQDFDKKWFDSWNSDEIKNPEWEIPEVIDPHDYFD